MNTVKIAVLVSGGGTNLQALIDAEKSGIIKSGKISLVLSSNPNAYALKRAENSGIKTAVVSKKECRSNEDFEEKITSYLDSEKIDLIVLAGFMCILSAEFTNKYKNRIINVHPSLIPSFCGAGYYGLHVHDVLDNDTPEILQKRVMEQAEWVILPQACEKICLKILNNKLEA